METVAAAPRAMASAREAPSRAEEFTPPQEEVRAKRRRLLVGDDGDENETDEELVLLLTGEDWAPRFSKQQLSAPAMTPSVSVMLLPMSRTTGRERAQEKQPTDINLSIKKTLSDHGFGQREPEDPENPPATARTTKSVKPEKKCEYEGCTSVVCVRGKCRKHGGKNKCKSPGCLKNVNYNGLCIAHGGVKPCSVHGCNTTVKARGFCKRHGGGSICVKVDCEKATHTNRLCWKHYQESKHQ